MSVNDNGLSGLWPAINFVTHGSYVVHLVCAIFFILSFADLQFELPV